MIKEENEGFLLTNKMIENEHYKMKKEDSQIFNDDNFIELSNSFREKEGLWNKSII